MSNRKTLKDSTNAISLPGLDYGAPPSDSPECQTTNHAGPPVAPVLPSPAPAKSSDVLSAEEILSLTRSRLESLLAPLAATNGTRTSGIYGLSFTGSSKSESLQKFMESRYRARTDVSGSPEYELRWKRWITVLGQPIFALRGSLRRTSDSGSTGWRTPTASDGVRGVHPNPNQRAGEFALSTEVHKSGWPTPKDCNSTGPSETETRQGAEDLQTAAQKTGVSGYATPGSRDWKDTPGMATSGTNPDGSDRQRLDQLPRQVSAAFGANQSGIPAKTGKSGGYLLNPAFSLWLMMGAPMAKYWLEAARRSISTRSPKRQKAALASSKAQETPSFQL